MAKEAVLIYYRVSSPGQSDRYSIQRQKETLPRFAERKGWRVIGEFTDDGVSGLTISKRPDAQAFLAAIASQKPDRVLFMDPTRWLRADTLDWTTASEVSIIRDGR